jgi:Phosphotransferase enzyme family
MSLSQGRASRVTDLGDGTVMRTGGSPRREAAIMQVARLGGFPVPRVVDARSEGLVLERIPGRTMGADLRLRPWRVRRHVDTLVSLHSRLHAIPFEGASMIHLDLHPENVLLSPRGPVVIDWTNARSGDPAIDIALTWLILRTTARLPGRLMAWLFLRRVGRDFIRGGLEQARQFRVSDPHVSEAERSRATRARP